MSLTNLQRQGILRAARGWLRVPYDGSHADTGWRDLSTPRSMDCSTFVCRVAADVLGHAPDHFVADAEWLIDNLLEVATPKPGDLVGYGRATTKSEKQAHFKRDALWHVMLYAGNGMVIGACDVAGEVVERSVAYEASLGARRWNCVGDPPAPFRALVRKP